VPTTQSFTMDLSRVGAAATQRTSGIPCMRHVGQSQWRLRSTCLPRAVVACR